MLGLSEFRFEVHAHPEDGPCEGQALCHVPEHPVGDIALGEERDKGQYYPRHHISAAVEYWIHSLLFAVIMLCEF